MKYQLNFKVKTLSNTVYNPLVIFKKIKDLYKNSVLFENNDSNKGQYFSYICFNSIAHIKIKNEKIYQQFPDETVKIKKLDPTINIVKYLNDFIDKFNVAKHKYNFINNGLFGFMSYDSVRYYETVSIKNNKKLNIPDILYNVYQNIIVIDHIKKRTYLLNYAKQPNKDFSLTENILKYYTHSKDSFKKIGKVSTSIDDIKFKSMITMATKYCYRGDVFQLVLSKRFSQKFEGDELEVFKVLKEINPSPYMFFYDYETFNIFGCSPEAQLIVENNIAEIHPIAGTYRRTGNEVEDRKLGDLLFNDDKENAEHVMLVDLARNDLSRNANKIKVETYKEIQFFSHVIHLVSKVTGKKNKDISTIQLVADTFPAGTLCGAPKHKAMQLIEKHEPINREFYGGAIGYLDFEGNFNHAIMIRTFLSKNKTLNWQAGAGIVIDSTEDSELKEVYNKTSALVKALESANER